MQEALATTGHHRDRLLGHTATARGLHPVVPVTAVLRVQSLVLIQVAQLSEHGTAHVALEADRGDGVGHRFIDHLDATIHCSDSGNAILELVDQGIVVAKGLCDVARLVVVRRCQLGEIHGVGALEGIVQGWISM